MLMYGQRPFTSVLLKNSRLLDYTIFNIPIPAITLSLSFGVTIMESFFQYRRVQESVRRHLSELDDTGTVYAYAGTSIQHAKYDWC